MFKRLFSFFRGSGHRHKDAPRPGAVQSMQPLEVDWSAVFPDRNRALERSLPDAQRILLPMKTLFRY